MLPAAQPPTTYPEQVALLRNAQGLLRLLAGLFVAYVLIPVTLGLVFILIMFPLTLALSRLILIWTPAYHLAGRAMGLNGLPDHLAKPPAWFILYSVVWVAVMLAMAGYFVYVLFSIGFCNQNLICLLAEHLAR